LNIHPSLSLNSCHCQTTWTFSFIPKPCQALPTMSTNLTAEEAEALNALGSRVTAIETALQGIESALKFLHDNADALKSLVDASIGSRLSNLENQAATAANPAEVAKRATANAIATIQPEITALRTTIDNFRRDATATWATKSELNVRLANQAAPAFERSKYPVPDVFSGKREDWKTFSNHLTLYFKAQDVQYRTASGKILFAISRLGNGPAFKYMQTYISKFDKPAAEQPQIISNYEIFLKTMADNFGVQNAHLVAEALQ
ncbi:hypothetical protein EDD21DRAFT_28350, partial [Dissophora ornata]